MNRRDFLVSTMIASGGLPALAQTRAADKPAAGPMPDVQVLVFDTFGTVVDWRSAVIAEGEQLGRAKGLKVDWAAFADAWRAGYGPSMNRVRTGQLPWTKLDGLHRMTPSLNASSRPLFIGGLHLISSRVNHTSRWITHRR